MESTPSADGVGRRILIVDDDEAHRYAMRRRLEIAGFSVVEAQSGSEGLQLAPGADAIILDVHLPDLTGFEVCRRLRESSEMLDVPIIHISAAYVADTDLVQGLRCGADAYLTRPVDEDVVVANLEALLRLRGNLLTLSEQLDETRRKEERARDLFLAVLGHDLRNPLDAISMSGQLLSRAPLSPELAAQVATRITSAALRMRHMLDDLQDYARSRMDADLALRRSPQSLTLLAAKAVDEFRAAQPAVAIELSSDDTAEGVWDGERLSRVIANLLRNAVEHGAKARPVTLRTWSQGSTRLLTVHNEGTPIPDEVMQQLFQPMVQRTTASPAASNMGLGLFVCREIVQAHGGAISVESGAGGTTFQVALRAEP